MSALRRVPRRASAASSIGARRSGARTRPTSPGPPAGAASGGVTERRTIAASAGRRPAAAADRGRPAAGVTPPAAARPGGARSANATASSFECTWSLPMMFCTWVRSVLGVMNSRSQISGVDRPSVSARSTSSSRGVSGSIGGRSAWRSRASATRRAIVTITERGSSVAPACAARTVATTSSTRLVLGEVAVGAGLDRLEHRLVVVDAGEHHDPRRRPAGLDRPGRLDAGPVGQPVVHEHHVERLALASSLASATERRGPDDRGCPAPASRTRASESRIRRWSSTSSTRIGRGVGGAGGAGARHAVRRRSGRSGDTEASLRPRARSAPGVRRVHDSDSSLAPSSGGSVPDNRAMRVAFLGLGLIGGSVARALRAADGWRAPSWWPGRRRAHGPRARARRGRDRRSPPGRSRAPRSRARTWSCWRRRRSRAWRSLGSSARAGAASLGPDATVTDVASTKARDRPRPRRRRRAVRRRPPDGGPRDDGLRRRGTPTLFRDRPWVVDRGGAEAATPSRASRRLARACGARTVDAGRARATTGSSRRSATCRCSRRWRSSRRSPGTGAQPRPDWARGGGARGRRAGATRRGSPAATRRWARGSPPRTPRRSRACCAVPRTGSTSGSRCSRRRAGPDAPALRARLAAARARLADGDCAVGNPDEQVLVVPRDVAGPGRGLARACAVGDLAGGARRRRARRVLRARAATPRRTRPTSRSSRTSCSATASAGS